MSNDKKTIGIIRTNQGLLQKIVQNGHFSSELDAAKFAMAFAIQKGIAVGRSDGSDTKWNVGSVDPTGELREMIISLYPDTDEPYRVIEHLINQGITDIAGTSDTPDIYGALFPSK